MRRTFFLARVQASRYVSGKSTTDFVLTMDAMELLYKNPAVNGYAIVSSDSDFTGLAEKLRMGGKYVIGFGRQNTLAPFVNACDTFAYVEDLTATQSDLPELKDEPPEREHKIPRLTQKDCKILLKVMKKVSDPLFDMDYLSRVADLLSEDDFRIRKYGSERLGQFFLGQEGHFETNVKIDDRTYTVRDRDLALDRDLEVLRKYSENNKHLEDNDDE
jgi:hypothetical protein